MKKRKNDLSVFSFYALLILTILFLISNCLTSGFLAKYLSSGSSNDDARVAMWEINFDDGNELNAQVPSTHLENGSKGEWGLDIINNSEVLARISETSEVKLRLYSPNFHADHHHDKWDFLKDKNEVTIDNPINFRIYAYNCSLDILNKNYITDGVFDNSVQVQGMNVQEHLILDTDTTNLTFEMILDNSLICYESTINIGNLGELFNLEIGTGNICIRVVWEVETSNEDYIAKDNFISYHVVKVADFDKGLYKGVVNKTNEQLVEFTELLTVDQINNMLSENSFTIKEENYVIAYKANDSFEYLIYTSSLGGEVMITLESLEGTYIKKCTKLNSEEKTIVESRTSALVTDLDTLMKFVEKLDYHSYLDFLAEKQSFEDATGYLGLGLECRISLNLKVEQVD